MALLLAFVLWTIAIQMIDVRQIGPRESAVGFATINGFFHELTGVHMAIYMITDWLGLVPIFICIGFGVLGLVQWINRKSLLKVDPDIIILGLFFLIVIAGYLVFDILIISFSMFMVIGRLVAGVHWFTDIVGGILLSAGLVMLYYSCTEFVKKVR